MQMFEVTEEMVFHLEVGKACSRLLLRRERVDPPARVDANRWHFTNRRIECTRLTPCRVVGKIDALRGYHLGPDQRQNNAGQRQHDASCIYTLQVTQNYHLHIIGYVSHNLAELAGHYSL